MKGGIAPPFLEEVVTSDIMNTVGISTAVFLTFVLYGLILTRTEIGRRILRPYARFFGNFFEVREDHGPKAENFDYEQLGRSIRRELAGKEIALSDTTEAEIAGYFREALRGEFSGEIAEAFKEVTKEEIRSTVNSKSLRTLEFARERLERFASAVSARGLVALLLGILSAIGALSILYGLMSAFSTETLQTVDYKTIIFVASSRVALVIFVTFISYFFLSLYRRSLDDAQRYQAELINLDAWIAAYLASANSSDEKLKAYAIARLLETDRAFEGARGSDLGSPSNETVKMSSDLLKEIIQAASK